MMTSAESTLPYWAKAILRSHKQIFSRPEQCPENEVAFSADTDQRPDYTYASSQKITSGGTKATLAV